MNIGTKIVRRLRRFVESLKFRAENGRLRAEIADAKALAFNETAPRSIGDMKDDLTEQIALLVERTKTDCPLLHTNCSACGHEIREDGTCGCEDNRHPIGKFQQTLLGHRADQINLMQDGLDALHEKIHAVERELDTLSPAPRHGPSPLTEALETITQLQAYTTALEANLANPRTIFILREHHGIDT